MSASVSKAASVSAKSAGSVPAVSALGDVAIADADFERVRKLALQLAGISLAASKKALVESRLRKRLPATGCSSYRDYIDLIQRPDQRAELQTALDLLTTNETYFFREQQHFDHLRDHVVRNHRLGSELRVWSAACSSGEEPYSIAMQLSAQRPAGDWQVLASDLSTQVLARARAGRYPLSRAKGVPQQYLQSYCLKGTGSQEGMLLIDAKLRNRVQFLHLNLIEPLPQLGQFDVIFLRNVMIYFDLPTKRRVLANLLPALAVGGFFYIGHSETLNGVTSELRQVGPAIYRKGAA